MKKKSIYIISILSFAIIILLILKITQKSELFLNNLKEQETGEVASHSLVLPDIKWLTYENSTFGFTFNYPNKAIPNQYWAAPDYSSEKIESTHILTNNEVLYIKLTDTSFDSIETKWQKDKQEFGGKTLDHSWRMVIRNVADEQALGTFVKEQYGSSCKFRKVATVFPDTFNIIIVSDGKSLDTSQCPVNYDYYIKYSPLNKAVTSWNTSQECQLGLNFDNCFDKQIAESFHYTYKEPLIYSTNKSTVLKTTKTFDYSAEQLKSMADECGTKYKTGYFDELVTKFSSSTKIVYSFKYQGASQSPDTFIVTLIPNKAGYTSIDQFKKDFDMCSVGGDAYPVKLNGDWLLFVSSCGSGYSDDSGKPIGCDEVRKIVEPSLRLN